MKLNNVIDDVIAGSPQNRTKKRKTATLESAIFILIYELISKRLKIKIK